LHLLQKLRIPDLRSDFVRSGQRMMSLAAVGPAILGLPPSGSFWQVSLKHLLPSFLPAMRKCGCNRTTAAARCVSTKSVMLGLRPAKLHENALEL
jgi:hypothetical protein